MESKISYIGVKALIVNVEGKVLITQEPTHFIGGEKWELPGGKLNEGEEGTSLEKVLAREIHEELGDQFSVSVDRVIDVMRRPWNKPGAKADMVFLAVFLCTYKGGEIVLSEENNGYVWVTESEFSNYEFIPGYLPVLEKYFKRS